MPNNFMKKISTECKISISDLEVLWRESESTADVTKTNNYGLATIIFKRKIKKHYPDCGSVKVESFMNEKFKHWPISTEYVILLDTPSLSKLTAKGFAYNWKDLSIFTINGKDINIRNIDTYKKNIDYVDIKTSNEYEGKYFNILQVLDKKIYEKIKDILAKQEIEYQIYINNKRRVK